MSGPAFITGWALETNYPSSGNAWGSQPCKVLPVGDIFTPGQPIPAEWLNYLFNQQSAAIISQQVSALLPSVQNWYPQQPLSAFVSLTNPLAFVAGCWDQLTQRWLLLAGDQINSKLQVFCSYGLDGSTQANWTALTQQSLGLGVAGWNVEICADPTTAGNVWLAIGGRSSSTIDTWIWNGSTWGAETSFFNGSQLPFTGTTPSLVKLHAFRGTVYLSAGSTTGTGAFMSTVAGGANAISSTLECGEIIMADNSGNGGPNNLLIAMPTNPTGSAVPLQYWTYDGTTWTALTLSIVQGTHRNVFGLVWTQDAIGPCFVLGVNDTSSLHTGFYRSSDGVNWTTSGTPTNSALGSGLASTGDSRIVMGYVDASNGGPSGAAYSIDGGSTWYQSQDHFTSNNVIADIPYFTYRQVVASSAAFMTFNSLFFRFSATAGLPPNHL